MCMKRFLFILFALLASISIRAQEGLNIQYQPGMSGYSPKIKVEVKGKKLKAYKLSKYLSVTYDASPAITECFEKAVRKDCKNAYDKEIGYLANHIAYAFLCLKPSESGEQQYVFYRNSSLTNKAKKEVTYVYMVGNVSMDELKRIFR